MLLAAECGLLCRARAGCQCPLLPLYVHGRLASLVSESCTVRAGKETAFGLKL